MSEFDKQKWLAQKQEQLSEMDSNILETARTFEQNPEELVELAEFSARFYSYSARNVLLIYRQNRGATFVRPFAGWKKEGYHVNKGEKGIQILAPTPKIYCEVESGKWKPLSNLDDHEKAVRDEGGFKERKKMGYKAGYVFDIAQTDYPVEDYPKAYNVGSDDEKSRLLFEALSEYIKTELKTEMVSEKPLGIALRGFFGQGEEETVIAVNSKLKDTAKLSTLLHELGHRLMHEGENGKKDENIKEFQADSFSIMFLSKFGMQPDDIRKRHLSNAYREFSGSSADKKVETFVAALDETTKAFTSVYEVIASYIEEHAKEVQA